MNFFSLFDTAKKQTETELLKENLLTTLADEIQLNFTYVSLLVFSTIIATLGLMTNSAAVVIGAMLIAPLSWPIIGLAVSVITTRKHLTKKSSITLSVSILLVLGLSAGIATIVPIDHITPEILARTQPNLLDLFIALASAVIGVLAVYYPRISASASGVAVSIALLPPLCVTGISVAYRSWELFRGSLLLFGANVAAIIFAGVITLYFLGFKPKKETEQNRFGLGLFLSSVFIVSLAFPLGIYLNQSLKQSDTRRNLNQNLISQVHAILPDSRVEDVKIIFPQSDQAALDISATIYITEGSFITDSQQNNILSKLSEFTQHDINLEMNIVDSLVLRREQDAQLEQQRQDIARFTRQELQNLVPDIEIETVNVVLENYENEGFPIQVQVIIRQYETSALNFVHKQQLATALKRHFQEDFLLEINLLPIDRLDEINQISKIKQTISLLLTEELAQISSDILVRSVDLSYTPDSIQSLLPEDASNSAILGIQNLDVLVTLEMPENISLTPEDITELEAGVSEVISIDTSISTRIIRYTSL